MREALSCIVCEGTLWNVDDGTTNQPYEGTTFNSYGQYGSTAFDPMDGRFLEMNICDSCLRQAATRGRVLLGQDSKLVTMPGPVGGGSVIGTTPIKRELVPWDPNAEEETEAHHLESWEDLEETRELGFTIDTRFSDDALKEMFESAERKGWR